MIFGRDFVFRPALSLAVGIALVILITLGQWQLHRLDWKEALIAQVAAFEHAEPLPIEDAIARARAGEMLEYAPVYVDGAFVATSEERVFGMYDQTPGAFLFHPFKTVSGEMVYINRGFAPQGAEGGAFSPPTGERRLFGVLRLREQPTPPAAWFRTSEEVNEFWFVRDPAAMAAAQQLEAMADFYIDQDRTGAGWPLGGTTRIEFTNRHMEYALTWFGLAATLVGVWIAMSLRPSRVRD